MRNWTVKQQQGQREPTQNSRYWKQSVGAKTLEGRKMSAQNTYKIGKGL